MYTRTTSRAGGRRRFHFWSAMVGAIALVSASCGENIVGPVEPDPPDESNGRIDITNNSGDLEERINRPNTNVPVDPPSGSQFASPGVSASISAASAPITLTLVAEVLPPTVEGQVVQATSVSIRGLDKVMVSYNMAGAPRLGAIDWIKKLKSNPDISSSAVFNDSDISALSFDGNYVYAAEATDAAGFAFPAVLERLRLEKDKFTLKDNLRIALTSFAATSTVRVDKVVYATSGDGGHVAGFNRETFELMGQYALDDARWVAYDKDGKRIVVMQGTPGRISVFAKGEFPGGSMNLLSTFSVPGADVAESKSTVEIEGDLALVAAGPEGVQIVCLDDGRILGSVPRPDPATLGLDPSVVVTNAVTADDEFMFISNGEGGVWVAEGSDKFKDIKCDEPFQVTMVGRLRFDDLQSVNHVEYKDKHLVVAAGLGGVKLVRVSGI